MQSAAIRTITAIISRSNMAWILRLLVFLASVTLVTNAQTTPVRWDWQAYTVDTSNPSGGITPGNPANPAPVGRLLPVLAIPNSQVQICATWLVGTPACSTLATTYTSAAGTFTCASTTQLTTPTSSVCSGYSDITGGIGAWLLPGTYAWVITTAYGTFGPYQFQVGTTGGGGGGGSPPAGTPTQIQYNLNNTQFGAYTAPQARAAENIPSISVLDYGAVADGQIVRDGAIGNGSATLTSASGQFSANTCGSGKVISVQYAGGTGGSNQPLVTTCTFVNSTTLTLGATATQAVTGAGVIWGTDNYSAFNSWITALPGQRGIIPCPTPGKAYLINTQQGALTLNFGSNEYITMDQSCQIDYVGGLLGAGITPLFTIPANTHHVYVDSLHVVGEWQSTATLTGVFEGFGNATVIEGQNNTGGSSDIQIVNPLFEHILGQGVKEFNYGTDFDIQVRNGRFLNVADTAMNVNTSNSVLDNNLCQNDSTGGGGCIEASGGNSQYTNNKSYYTTYNYAMQFGGLTGSAPPFTGSHVEGNQVYYPIGTQGCYSFNSGFTYGVIAHNTCYGVTNLGMVAANSGAVLSGYNKYIGNIMQGTNSILNSVTSIDAGSGSGTVFLTNFNEGCTGSTATVTLASGAFSSATVTAGGTLCNIEPTFANCTNGTATCAASTVAVTTTLTAGGTGFYVPGSPGNEFYGNSTTGVGFGYNQQDGVGNVSEGNNWWGSAYDITLISVTTSMKDRAQHCRISLNSGATLSVDSVVTNAGTYCESTFPSTFVAPVQSPGFWTSFGTTGASTNIPGFSNAGSWNIAALFNRQASQGDISSPMALDFGETNAGSNNTSHSWIQTEYNGNFSSNLALFVAQTGNSVISPNASMAGLRLLGNVTTGPSFTPPNTYVFIQGGGPSEGMGANVGSSFCTGINGTPCTDPGQGGIGYASFLRGPSTAPTGSCSTIGVGVWEFTQDGVASYCNATSWTTPFGTGGGSLPGGALGSLPYQSAANTTTFIASPTTNGHAFVPMWQPTGSAIAPTAVDLGTFIGTNVTASSPIVATPSTLGTQISCPTCGTTGGGTSLGVNGGGTLGSANLNAISPVADANYLALLPKISAANIIIEAPYATGAALGVVQGDASTLTISSGVISCTTATSSQIGCVKPDGTVITDTAGAITVAHGSSSLFGVIKVDGTTITASGGVISATGGSVSGGTSGQLAVFGSATTITSGITVGNSGSDIPQLTSGLLNNSVINWASPSSIGGTAPAPGAFTSLVVTTAATLTETTAPSGAAGFDKLWGDSTKHRFGANFNNAGTIYLVTASGSATPGDCPQFGSNGIDLADSGAPCGGGGGGSPAFSAIQNGTNTVAAMVVGTGSSLSATGTGTITATGMPYSGLTGSVPTWNQNTTGTAANLSGTPALPNGTTATTQTTTDTSGKLATDAFAANVVNAAVNGTTNSYGLFSGTHVIGAGHITDNGSVITASLPFSTGAPVLFSTLTCTSGQSGTISVISDPSSTPTYWTAAAGTGTPGATSAPVFCDGATLRYF
jgi:hypothetical protein